jgi:glycosyltransferase involved in cell wall biosynthesis
LREIKPDITHFHGAAGYTLFYDQPHVLTIHGVNEKDALFDGKSLGYLRSKVITAQERFGRRRCENVIIISSYVLALLKRDIKGRTWTIENPVDDQFFYVDRIPQCTVLFSGVITPRKNVLGLLKAFALVLRCVPEARLRLAGPERVPDYAADCRRFVREGGISDRVDFLGPLSAEQMCSELSTAGCLALLSYQETAPVIIAEAMAAGVPVVASRVGGIPYIFDDGQSGYLTEPEDTDTAANRLCALLLDHSERDKMVIRGREAAHKRFRTSSVVAKTLYCYRQVLG